MNGDRPSPLVSVGFLHTAPAHVAVFRTLLGEIAPGARDLHLVDAVLLSDACRRGVDAGVTARLTSQLRELARRGADIILCTCSTLGARAEDLSGRLGIAVVRIDRPMAEQAVAGGGRVAVVAAIEPALDATRRLLERCAAQARTEITVIEAPCLEAWELSVAGDLAGYAGRVARHVRDLAAGEVDVVVLAQASMAPALALLVDLAVPVLAAPRLGVARAVELAAR